MIELLNSIVAHPELHCKWLNTLSMMENTGARKISACEDPLKVNEIILKHAAEEARHAYYLKKQIAKILSGECPTYEWNYLLAPVCSFRYLHQLDVWTSRYLKEELKLSGKELQFAAYLLVTYAIEVRADSLYPVYQQALEQIGSKVNVKSIIAEEEGHLEEMIRQLEHFSEAWKKYADRICAFEEKLFQEWQEALRKDVPVTSSVKV